MIYARLNYNGRIGNILFIIAAGASLAKRMGVGFKCVVHSCREGYTEQFFDNICRNVDFVYEIPQDVPMRSLLHFEYRDLPMEDNICLDGWFQTEKYFDKELVRKLFRIEQTRREELIAKYPVLGQPGLTAVHVRRGDYLKPEHVAHFPVCNMSYFNKAIDLMGRDGKFLIFSDDIEWCKSNFRGENFYFMEGTDELTDLYAQTLCANNIISNSTFSWWGAWLNENPNKRVIAPVNWFGPGNSFPHLNHDTRDVIPETWERVANPLSATQKMFVCKHYMAQCLIFAKRVCGLK